MTVGDRKRLAQVRRTRPRRFATAAQLSSPSRHPLDSSQVVPQGSPTFLFNGELRLPGRQHRASGPTRSKRRDPAKQRALQTTKTEGLTRSGFCLHFFLHQDEADGALRGAEDQACVGRGRKGGKGEGEPDGACGEGNSRAVADHDVLDSRRRRVEERTLAIHQRRPPPRTSADGSSSERREGSVAASIDSDGLQGSCSHRAPLEQLLVYRDPRRLACDLDPGGGARIDERR